MAVCSGLLPSAEQCRVVQRTAICDWPHLIFSSFVAARFVYIKVCAVVYSLHQIRDDGQAAVAGKAGAQQGAQRRGRKSSEGQHSEMR